MQVSKKGFVALSICTVFWANIASSEPDSVIRIATPALPQSLVSPFRTVAPPSIYVTAAVFDSLTRFDHDGTLQPWLAIRWEREGSLSWSFDLRQNVRFSNGEPFDAEAVVAAIKYLNSPDGAVEGVKREMPFLEKAEVVDHHRVRLVTLVPVPLLPRFLAAMPIPAPRQWARLGPTGFAREPVGTGPFQVVSRRANALALTAFEGSWRAPVERGLEFTAAPLPSSRVAGLLSGVFDVAFDLGPEDLRTLKDNGHEGRVTITNSISSITFFLARPGPLSDIRVRQALNMAVNRQAIIDGLLGGATRVSTQPATPQTLGYDPTLAPYPYDPSQAKVLLTDAGFPGGFRFTMETSIGYAPNDAAIFQQIAQDLRAIGVQMDIITLPVTEFLTRRGNATLQAEAFASEWPAWPNLDGLRAVRTHSCLREPIWYCNSSATPLIEAAQAEEDPDQAIALRRQVMRFFRDDAPALFLFDAPQFTGLRAGVSGYREDANLVSYDQIDLGD